MTIPHGGHLAIVAGVPAALWVLLRVLRPRGADPAAPASRAEWEARLGGGLGVVSARPVARPAHAVATGTAPRSMIPAVVLCATAGVVHALAIGEHAAEWPLAGLFFAAVAVAQIASAVVLARTPAATRATRHAIVALNLGVAAIWLVSRTTGLPLGSQPWTPEPAGVMDVAATVDEVLVALALFGSLGADARPSRTTDPAGDGVEGEPARRSARSRDSRLPSAVVR